jgi:thymidylate synthase (FAD)
LNTPHVEIIGCTQFFGVPQLLQENGILPTQDQGSDGARLIECAGRSCYDSYGKGRASSEYHTHIKEVGHGSVTAHATINYFLSGISRGLTHELVRHGVGTAISQRSTRYVDECDSPWIWHPLIDQYCSEPQKMELAEFRRRSGQLYRTMADHIQNQMVAAGIDKFTARKQARGAARGILGNALETEMVWTANIRALRHVIEMRAHSAADAEIRVLANRLLEEAVKIVPEYFNDYERQPCDDGIGFSVATTYRKI